MTHELFTMLWRSALAAAVALAIVLAARVPARRWLGAHAAYSLWLLVPVAAVAIVLPAPVRPLVVAQPAAPSAQAPTTSIDLNATIASTPFDAQPWLLTVWMIGACALLLWFVLQQRRYLKNLGALVHTDAGMLRAQTSVGSPALVGALRPRIVVPQDFESRYTPRERELVLAHERAHLRRGDAQINALVVLLRCLNWFNPLFHLAASRFRFDQELACDALVVARFPHARRCYADAMLKAQLANQARHELRLPAGCYWPSSHPLKARIAMLKMPQLSGRRRAIAAVVVAALMLGVGYASWAAQPSRYPAPQAVSAAPDSDTKLRADLLLSLDGSKLDSSWSSETHNLAFMHHDGDSNSWTLLSVSGQQFIFTVRKDAETWKLTGVATDRRDGSIEFNGTLKHNDATATKLSLVVVDGRTATFQMGDDLGSGGFKGLRVDLTLGLAKAAAELPPTTTTQTPLAADVPPSEIRASRTLKPPRYPPEAVKNHVSGRVVLKVHVDEKGAPLSAEVQSVEPESASVLSDAAIAATMQWRFNPGSKDDKPVGGDVLVPVDFTLTDEDGMPLSAATTSPGQTIGYRKLLPPPYPAQMIAGRVTGKLYVKARINPDGSVAEAYVDQAYPISALVLADSTLAAVRSWTFNTPAPLGSMLTSDAIIPVEYQIDGYVAPQSLEPVPTIAYDAPVLQTIQVRGASN